MLAKSNITRPRSFYLPVGLVNLTGICYDVDKNKSGFSEFSHQWKVLFSIYGPPLWK
jgi:hypothetical protein